MTTPDPLPQTAVCRRTTVESADRSPDTLDGALEALAAAQPAAPLLHLPGRPALTYADLSEQIGHVRERLRDWGIVPGEIIAGCIESRPHLALACAALPSSATFTPLNAALSEDAYAALLDRLRPKAVLVEAAYDHPLRAAAAKRGIAELRLRPDPDAAFGRFLLDRSVAGDPGSANAPERAEFAYVLVTSGTTGRAKLVPLGHRQMLAYARTMIDWLRFTPRDVGCSLSPFHLAGGLRATLLIPMLGGGSVVCLPEADTDGFFRAIDEFRPTYLSAPFAIQRALLRRCAEFRHEVTRSRLRFLRTTAGRMDPDEIDRLAEAFRTPVVVGFGSTEVAGITHDPLPPRARKRGAVGLPTAGEVAVMDSAGRLSPRGSVGELVVRGPLVFDGYLDDPELTARSFAGDWFRTGDLGRIDADGYVFLNGRITELINRGGEKILPAEIDSALESLEGIDEAAAFGIPHPSLGEELVAAVVRSTGATIEEAGIIEQVRRRLGPRQVPRRIHFVDRLPRTDSGKVRRNALAQAFGADAGSAARDGAAATSTAAPALEAALARVWSPLLRGCTIGRDDDFFLLGGDSLSGAQLLVRVREIFGVELPIEALFGEAATIAGMARAIGRARASPSSTPSGSPDAPGAFAADP